MSDTTTDPAVDFDASAYDLEFFLDPMCPFAWQTSRWLVRVAELKDLKIGWRFISLQVINEQNDTVSEDYRKGAAIGHGYLRVLAAARAKLGNDAVGDLYTGWGERLWSSPDVRAIFQGENPVSASAILAEIGLPAELADEADEDSWDELIVAESNLAFERTGPDVGTPIITYGEGGNSLFGPVISSVPDDDEAVRIYDALRVLVDFPQFSEIKRTKRPPLDLPAFNN